MITDPSFFLQNTTCAITYDALPTYNALWMHNAVTVSTLAAVVGFLLGAISVHIYYQRLY